MASRLFQFHYKYERDTVETLMNVSIGASGAPTLTSQLNKGIVSITRNSAGTYTILLKDTSNKLMGVDMSVINATGIPTAPIIGIKNNNVNSNTAPSIQIVTSNLSGVATDPANGDILLISIKTRLAST
jgi:hypothetical protein